MIPLLLAPLALAGPLDGAYAGPGIQLTLSDDGGGGYVGTATVGGARYAVSAQPSAGGLSGIAQVDGTHVSFVGITQGEGLFLTTEAGDVWMMSRLGAAPTASPSPRTPAQPPVAQTPLATVSADAADAFYEALIFCMDFAGASEADKRAISREVVHQQLALNLSALPPEGQVALANARTIWTDTHARWGTMSQAERREFAAGVLTLAYGEQAGSGRAAAASSSTGSIDVDAMVGVVPGSDCWAGAGCSSYDSSTGSYEYETFDSVPSYDYE